ncbi:MAG TPA: hypothetical protein VGL14_06445 [Methylomirabilota bacterium]
MRELIGAILVLILATCLPSPTHAQTTVTPAPSPTETDSRWEVSVEGRVGFPVGYIRVNENEIHGTRLRLSDLGLDVSEAIEAGIAFWLTPRDAVRASYLYYFLRGGRTFDRAIVYDGQEYTAGRVDANLDFWRASLAYEHVLAAIGDGGRLIASAGLTFVWLNAGLAQHARTKAEDFYLQELPVPIVGLRYEALLTERLGLRASIAGGLLPKVDSLRTEGGTVYTWQSHADASLGVTYALTNMLTVEAGYQFTYVHQHEKSHEDDNVFELIDNGPRARLTLRFW